MREGCGGEGCGGEGCGGEGVGMEVREWVWEGERRV